MTGAKVVDIRTAKQNKERELRQKALQRVVEHAKSLKWPEPKPEPPNE